MLIKRNKKMSGILLMAVFALMSLVAYPLLVDAAPPSIDNQASATYEDSNSNSFTANSNTVTTTVNSVYGVSVTSPADQSDQGGNTVYYAYTVTNSGNDDDDYSLSASSGSGWTVTLYADDGAGGGTANDGIHQAGETTVTNTTGTLSASGTYQFFVAVAIPANTADNATDGTTTLTVTGNADAGASDDTTDDVVTTCDAPDLSIDKKVRNVTDAGAFANTATADPGDTLEYRMLVTNNGAISATAVVLTDNDNANTTFVSGSIMIGNSATCASNTNRDDDSTQEAGETCASDDCGQANADGSGNITAYLGNGANESTGGSLAATSTVYVCFQVTVD
jgi:uncharacterized repeat protein (TIGR01451 family)